MPEAIACGEAGDTAWLVLEHLELKSHGPAALLGEQLASLHDTGSDRFGWSHDNYIGTTPQLNRQSDNWEQFRNDDASDNQLSPPKDNELELLATMRLPLDGSVRLSCQARILSGTVNVDIAFQDCYSPDSGLDPSNS